MIKIKVKVKAIIKLYNMCMIDDVAASSFFAVLAPLSSTPVLAKSSTAAVLALAANSPVLADA